MPSPRTIGIGFTLACADHEKIEWRFVSATISAADMVSEAMWVVVMRAILSRSVDQARRRGGARPAGGTPALRTGHERRGGEVAARVQHRCERVGDGVDGDQDPDA